MKNKLRHLVKQIPFLGGVLHRLYRQRFSSTPSPAAFPGSQAYWERRYAAGGDSGSGSYGKLAEFKAGVLNQFAARAGIQTVIEFGCGDGNQLALASYPEYLGVDVSETAITLCRKRFAADPTRRFCLLSEYAGEQAELALSLDVIFHLIEPDIYQAYMRTLFAAASRYVIIYASDTDENRGCEASHFKHRKFTAWVSQHAPGWRLVEHIPNAYPYQGEAQQGSISDFYIFARL
jgi:SAM-dependent methyltransferase